MGSLPTLKRARMHLTRMYIYIYIHIGSIYIYIYVHTARSAFLVARLKVLAENLKEMKRWVNRAI